MSEIINLDSERLLRFEQRLSSHDDTLREIKLRLADLQKGQASVKGDIANLYAIIATLQVSLDNLNDTTNTKLDTILRRLDAVQL